METGYVYLFGSTTYHWLKIGVSSEPVQRHAGLAGSLPFQLSIWDVRRLRTMTRARELEQELHAVFNECRLNGEWFRPHPIRYGQVFSTREKIPRCLYREESVVEIR